MRSGGSRASERFSPMIFAYDETGCESWEKGQLVEKVEIQILKIMLLYVRAILSSIISYSIK